MNASNPETRDLAALPQTSPAHAAAAVVWPPRGYARQVAKPRRAIGQRVYLVELTFNGLAIGVVYQGEPHVLLDKAASQTTLAASENTASHTTHDNGEPND